MIRVDKRKIAKGGMAIFTWLMLTGCAGYYSGYGYYDYPYYDYDNDYPSWGHHREFGHGPEWGEHHR